MKQARPLFLFLGLLGISNLALFISWLRLPGALMLTLALPGWSWSALFPLPNPWPGRPVLALGLGFALTSLAVLWLHYLPGPITTTQLLVCLNLLALLPLVGRLLLTNHIQLSAPPISDDEASTQSSLLGPRILVHLRLPVLLLLIVVTLFLRFAHLGYSEFQGDEALAMIFSAEALTGVENVFFLRSKGPGEMLLPMALWRLNGTLTELLPRLPSALAGLGAILTIYLLGRDLFNRRVAVYGAAFLALNGFMLAFSRIVQYQMIVVWMSTLSVWALWRWHRSGRYRWGLASGLFAGVGLLAHYDALLVLPALGWLIIRTRPTHFVDVDAETKPAPTPQTMLRYALARLLPLWVFGFLGSTLPFYLPYFYDPQIASTGSYIGERIGGGLLKNNLPSFFHFNSFYSSFYYTLFLGLLLVWFVAWTLQHMSWAQGWGPATAVALLIGLSARPDILEEWTFLPFALLLLGAFISPVLTLPLRVILIWFAVPFLGYNFGVARPLTHIYTIIPAWVLLAAWVAAQIRLKQSTQQMVRVAFILLCGFYLWNAFLRHDVEFVQDFQVGWPAFYWTPFKQPPETGFFGFPHKTGWKAAGALLAEGRLKGDYDSNEEEDVTSWYTRQAPRACRPGAEYFFRADDLVDALPLPQDLLAEDYVIIGRAELVNDKGLTFYQRRPAMSNLGTLDYRQLARTFDRTAQPQAFVRTPHWQVEQRANFGGLIELLGYDLDTRRAYPGGRITLALYWRQLAPVDDAYKVFVQLDPQQKYAQADNQPVCDRYPTNRWRPDQIVTDRYALTLSPVTPPGRHPLVIGLYRPEDGSRLDFLDVAGNPAGVILPLTEVMVQPAPEQSQ